MWFKNIFFFLFLLVIPGYVSAALGITRDGTPNNYYHWSGAGKFSQDEAGVDNELPGLARQAYEEMLADAQANGVQYVPSTMAALAVGDRVYFSSGLIGAAYLVNPGEAQYVQEGVASELNLAIFRCQQSYNNEHRYDARCAEPLAVQQFLVNNKDDSIIGRGRVSTYGKLDRNDPNNVGILNPCDTKDGRWGCQVLMDKLQIRRVGNQGDKPGLPGISPTESLPHCFWT